MGAWNGWFKLDFNLYIFMQCYIYRVECRGGTPMVWCLVCEVVLFTILIIHFVVQRSK